MVLSRAECIERYGSDYLIQQKINAGELYRVSKGIFSEQAYVPELAIMTYKYPKAVVTMSSAFYHYGLTDAIPDRTDLATDRDAPKITDPRVHQYFQPKELFSAGVQNAGEQGYSFRIYSKERMLIELLRYKNKLSFDLYKEVLLNYRKIMGQLDVQKIQDYAMISPKRKMILNALQMEVF